MKGLFIATEIYLEVLPKGPKLTTIIGEEYHKCYTHVCVYVLVFIKWQIFSPLNYHNLYIKAVHERVICFKANHLQLMGNFPVEEATQNFSRCTFFIIKYLNQRKGKSTKV